MLNLNTTTRFKKDYKLCIRRRYNLNLLQTVVDTLRIPESLPPKNREHSLSGEYAGCQECHILPDWLLIYRIESNGLYLIRTGTHADLFGM